MPVRRRPERGPDAWLIDFRVNGVRYRLTREAPNKRAAEALEREERARIEAGLLREDSGLTVAGLLARYWDEHGRRLASAGSERAYLNAWSDALGDAAPVATIGAPEITSAVASWRGTVSDSTINRRLSCLQRIWRRAEDLWNLHLARVPWGRLKLAEPLPRDRSIPEPTLEQLFDALPERSRPVVAFMLATGLRRGATLRLTASDVDRDRAVIRAVSKGRAGGKPTPVPLTKVVATILEDAPEAGPLFLVSKQEGLPE